jgi:(p)ppGpp synthase/HD superfamily hydrolase
LSARDRKSRNPDPQIPLIHIPINHVPQDENGLFRSRISKTMEDFGRQLSGITLAPYIHKAMALIGVRRKAGSNMFRHQIATMGILLDYKILDPVLLKAAVIHDLFENAAGLPGVTREDIVMIDGDGPAVYDLVMEVTIRIENGVKEPKAEYLGRIMQHGTPRAKILKLADRISNIISLGFVNDPAFVRRYIDETKDHIIPHAGAINRDMHRELSDLLATREKGLGVRS